MAFVHNIQIFFPFFFLFWFSLNLAFDRNTHNHTFTQLNSTQADFPFFFAASIALISCFTTFFWFALIFAFPFSLSCCVSRHLFLFIALLRCASFHFNLFNYNFFFFNATLAVVVLAFRVTFQWMHWCWRDACRHSFSLGIISFRQCVYVCILASFAISVHTFPRRRLLLLKIFHCTAHVKTCEK